MLEGNKKDVTNLIVWPQAKQCHYYCLMTESLISLHLVIAIESTKTLWKVMEVPHIMVGSHMPVQLLTYRYPIPYNSYAYTL